MFAPPLLSPSLRNLTSTAGHRQPIKLGLRGYLHTRLQQEKLENTAVPALLPFTNSFSSFFLVAHSSHPPLYFTLLPCFYPPFASSSQSRHPVSPSHNGGIQKYPFCQGTVQPHASWPPDSLYTLDPEIFIFLDMVMKCGWSQCQNCAPCVCGRWMSLWKYFHMDSRSTASSPVS